MVCYTTCTVLFFSFVFSGWLINFFLAPSSCESAECVRFVLLVAVAQPSMAVCVLTACALTLRCVRLLLALPFESLGLAFTRSHLWAVSLISLVDMLFIHVSPLCRH